MRSEEIYDAVTNIRSDIIDGAENIKAAKKRGKALKWIAGAAAALVIAAIGGVLLISGSSGEAVISGQGDTVKPGGNFNADLSKYAVVESQYPKMSPYPDESAFVNHLTGEFDSEGFDKVYDAWRGDLTAQRAYEDGYDDGLDEFTEKTIIELLTDAEGENRVYSPLNIYMALGMLAEVTDGSSRQQILDLLGADNIDTLRERAKTLWNVSYCDDGATTSVLASSLWLNEDITFNEKVLGQLAESYYASSFSGEMGSDGLNSAFRGWLNEQTGGMLEEQIGGISLDPRTELALATTIYFRAKWYDKFFADATEAGVFHGADGSTECEFMHMKHGMNYCWGEKFTSIAQSLQNDGEMRFILPDKGVSIDELLNDEEAMEFILYDSTRLESSFGGWAKSKYVTVNEAIPKFDISSQFDLIESLKSLGVTDVFDPSESDFSPLTDDELFVGQAQHGARVMIDEEGCTAAAYTEMMLCGAGAPPEDEVDFVLDRPFIFVVTGFDGQPLFIGVVNNVK